MGSGALASAGWQNAAYQRNIWYMDGSGTSRWGSLTASESNPACYTIDLHNTSGSWETYFFFGGPKCD